MNRARAIGAPGEDAGAGSSVGGGPGVNLPLLRNHNAALVLDLLRTAGEDGISRLELADRTGLTPQAVSKITARLRDEGLAAEAGRRASTGGKPRTVLRLVRAAAYAVGLQLDRDEMTAVLLDLAGTRVATRVVPLDLGAGPDVVTEQATQQVQTLLADCLAEPRVVAKEQAEHAVDAGGPRSGAEAEAEAEPEEDAEPGALVLGVGVAMPGPLDHVAGVPHRVTGYPEWDGYRLRDKLAARLGLPVVLDKDTNAAALGLVLRGTGGSFAYLHLGTGIGAGLVLDGELYRGSRTGAGEFGHQIVQLDGPPCGCGKRGCIEALCLAAVARGDLAEAARVLGVGVANLVELLDIEQVLLGGRVVAAAESEFIRGVRSVLVSRTRARVGPAAGGAYRVAEGAAQLVLAPVFGRAEASYASPPPLGSSRAVPDPGLVS
ncbi:ROK family transcriptional regulator [Streptomyces sp. NPDC002133]|uniref:ROK family transcriptional regulator n=1 Tax=Streptomyces sp. NPDC002133 TaxID=3154409 RepID=UPI00332730F5